MSSISASSYSGWAIVTTFTQTSGGQIDFKAFLHLILSQASSSWHDCIYQTHRIDATWLFISTFMLLDFRQMISYFFQRTKTSPCLQLGGVRLTCADSNITAYASETPISSFRDCPCHLCNSYPVIAARTCQ